MTLRAAVVSRYLKSQGLERSESWTTQVRGWHDYSSGFRAMQLDDDSVRVEYMSGSFSQNEVSIQRELDYLKRVVEALDGKYKATFHEGVLGPYVVVTKQ